MKRLYINDFILIFLIICALVISAIIIYKPSDSGCIIVMHDNKFYKEYNLDSDTVESVDSSGVTIEINSGKASIKSSDCPDKLCIHSKKLSKDSSKGASIVCLPNKVAIIKSDAGMNKEVDAVAG